MQFSDTFLKKHIVIDGGMGTMLQSAGLPAGASPDVWNITHPDAVRAVHTAYLAAGADCILIETMSALDEAILCVQSAKKYGAGLPVLCTLTYSPAGRLMTGEPVETVVAALEEAGVDAIGCNCGVGPEQLVALLSRFTACATKPLVMQPNAGLPEYRDGQTVYLVGPDAFALEMDKLAFGGVWALGGCCGTTPEHIAHLAAIAAK
jgi:5-methyltetrahydrofolate--homocysteine methyltransferase